MKAVLYGLRFRVRALVPDPCSVLSRLLLLPCSGLDLRFTGRKPPFHKPRAKVENLGLGARGASQKASTLNALPAVSPKPL